jgi:hypothetical protein
MQRTFSFGHVRKIDYNDICGPVARQWPRNDSRQVRLGIGPPFGTLDQILSCSSFSADNYLIILPKRPL